MMIRFKVNGRDYSRNKNRFKSIMKDHGLRWRGTFQNPWWGNDTEKVTARYERDEDRNITISATLTWEGTKESAFLRELRQWASDLDVMEKKVDRKHTKQYKDDLLIFEMVHKPQKDYLEHTGRPRSWIRKDLEGWEEEKERRFG